MKKFVYRIFNWLLSPGFTGFSRVAHIVWCVGGFLMFLVFPPSLICFGYCCWNHDLMWGMTAGFAAISTAMMANCYLVVASKMMTTESIIAKQEGRDLEF